MKTTQQGVVAEREVQELVERLSPDDVRWDGQEPGLLAWPASGLAQRILAIGEPAISALIDAMADERRFAAAHALLTFISGVEYAAIPWNGLDVDIRPDGTPVFQPEQRFALAERWLRWQRTQPRPRLLPE